MTKLVDYQILKYRALSAIFSFLREATIVMQFALIFTIKLYSIGVSLWIIVLSSLIFIALSRIIWVQIDAKNRIYKHVFEHYKAERIHMLQTSFR